MTEQQLDRFAEQETQWLHYYGLAESRLKDEFDDVNFYDRLVSIGYTKRVIPLPMRCVASYVTADTPVLETPIEGLKSVGGPRDHQNNVYSALEYVLAKKVGRFEEFKTTLKS